MYPTDAAMKELKESVALESIEEEYDAYYLPGGHGTVMDFPGSLKLQALIGSAFDNGECCCRICGLECPDLHIRSLGTCSRAGSEACKCPTVIPLSYVGIVFRRGMLLLAA